MSIDIDWSLLAIPTSSYLVDTLIDALNDLLHSSTRPSFLGPISVTAFDFGTTGPEVEIKDVRDVWRAFDEGDDEGDEIAEETRTADEFASAAQRRKARYAAATHSLIDDESYELIAAVDDTADSIYSGFASARHSVMGVGIGLGAAGIGSLSMPGTGSHLVPLVHTRPHHRNLNQPAVTTHRQPSTRARPLPSAPPLSSPPPSPPARPAGLVEPHNSSLPSIQIHFRLDHSANISLTLLTSLQVNYPSPLFMTLPLKLSITGLTLAADLVLAYSSAKNRVHLCIIDADEANPGLNGHHVPIGQRIIPNLHIESEIGHTDAHVLRNVGKVERFIVDVIRKTLVEELVFPNFHTIAL